MGHVTSIGLQDISNVCGHLSVGGLVLRGTALGMWRFTVLLSLLCGLRLGLHERHAGAQSLPPGP